MWASLQKLKMINQYQKLGIMSMKEKFDPQYKIYIDKTLKDEPPKKLRLLDMKSMTKKLN